MMLHSMYESLREKGCINADDRIALRKQMLHMSSSDALECLQTCVSVVEGRSETSCPIDIRKSFASSLECGTIVDDLCDIVAIANKDDVTRKWSTETLQQLKMRKEHLKRTSFCKLYTVLHNNFMKKCAHFYDSQILQATYPEIDWDNCTSYHESLWRRFQPDKMPYAMRGAFVYATRHVGACKAQNNEWVHRHMRRRMKWWSAHQSLPRHRE